MKYTVAYGPRMGRLYDIIRFDELDTARWLFDSFCESMDDEKRYVELCRVFDTGEKRSVSRQLRF